MQYIRNMILVAVFGWVSISCNPSEPPPPPPAPVRPAVSSNLPADAQSPSGSGLKPVAGNSGGSVNAGPLANSIGTTASNPIGGQPNAAGAFSAITGLIQSISSGGGIDSIGTSIQNLIASFTGGASGGGALSGFGNLLSGLIPGLGGASSTPPSP